MWKVVALAVLALASLGCQSAFAQDGGPSSGRGWEQVSPVDKNGANVQSDGTVRAASNGERLAYESFGNFAGGGGSGSYRNQFLSSRTTTGWSTIGVNSPHDPNNPYPTELDPPFAWSRDLSRGVTRNSVPLDDPNGPGIGLFGYNTHTNAFTPMSHPASGVTLNPDGVSENGFSGANRDFSRVVFQSNRALTLDAPTTNDGVDSQEGYLYAAGPDGLELVSYLPPEEGGAPVPDVTVGLGIGMLAITVWDAPFPGEHAVAADGSRLFFSTHIDFDGERKLYQRRGLGTGNATTVRVDGSERNDCREDPTCGGNGEPDPTPDPNGDLSSYFQVASADGSVAFFTSAEKLTNDAKAEPDSTGGCRVACDLYRWDANAPAGERLTDLTTADPAGGGAGGAEQLLSLDSSTGSGGVIGASDDGLRLYFAATGNLTDDASGNGLKLYYWQDDAELRRVANLDPADSGAWSTYPDTWMAGARITPDGEHLLIRSRAPLSGYDNAGHAQIYRYTAATDTFVCVSCNPNTPASTGDATLKRRNDFGEITPLWKVRNMSEDGSRVFFETPEALVDADDNTKIDVYEWKDDGTPDGTVGLISGGQSSLDSAFVDASANGDDVFFTTAAQLACQDTDSLVDVYVARTGGGFGPCPAPPTCNQNTCRQPSTPPPPTRQASTEAFDGQGNVRTTKPTKKAKRCKRGYKRKRVKGKVKCVKAQKKKRHGRRSRR